MMMEKRITARQKSLLRGFVYFGGSPCAVECIVRDISDTGARLKFRCSVTIANTLELNIPVKGQKLRGRVIWQQDDEIGIAFMDSIGLVPAHEPAFSASNEADDELAKRVQQLETEIVALKQTIKRLVQKIGSQTEAA